MRTQGRGFYHVKLKPRFGNAVAFHWEGHAADKREAYETARRHASYAHKALLAATGLEPGDADPALTACATFALEPAHEWRDMRLPEEERLTWRLGGAMTRLAGTGAVRPGLIPDVATQQTITRAFALTDPSLLAGAAPRGAHGHAARNGVGKGPHGHGFQVELTMAPETGISRHPWSDDPLTRPALLAIAMACEIGGGRQCFNAHALPPESATLAAAWRRDAARRSAPALAEAARILEAMGIEDLAEGVRKRLEEVQAKPIRLLNCQKRQLSL